jgi:N-acetylneuraminic acid mutarotase
MIVWGGAYGWLNTGGRYDPATNSWAPTSTFGAPEGRTAHTAVWAGDRMIVWGGYTYTGGYGMFGTGGRYDPVADSWMPTYSPGAPEGRGDHTAVWTGNEMIVWGGGYWTGGDGLYIEPVVTGGRYNPAIDSWTPTPTVNVPDARFGHTAVWTGDYMVVWGGGGEFDSYNTGGRYYPVGDVWGSTSLAGAPSARSSHTAVWTGDEMIVWGGGNSDTGARYDPYGDSWTPVSMADAPGARNLHTAVWTGSEMIVWGGGGSNTGARYGPSSDSWTPLSVAGAPDGRSYHTAVWTGDEMIVWGGGDYFNPWNTGGRYDPATDTWEATSIEVAPLGRRDHSAVWTGNRMVVWGGDEGFGSLDSGGRYNPHDDSWEPTSFDEAPSTRDGHSAVWTGDRMIVWGGYGPRETGGRYDPDGADQDGDGHGCVIDCDDGDPGVFASPGEVRGLRFTEDKTTFEWIAVVAGEATVYDIVRGLQSELPVGSGPSEICLASDHVPGGGAAGMIPWTDSETPAPGAAFWYLVRATNACGRGTYGFPSSGGTRNTEACQ